MADRQPSVLDVLIQRLGWRRGVLVATFIAQWARAQAELGDDVSLEDAALWWREARRTWYRRLAMAREVFGPDWLPNELAAYLIAHHGAQVASPGRGLALLGELPAGRLRAA